MPGGAAAEFHRLLGLTPAEAARLTATRRDEDRVACGRLGAEAVHWPFPDAVDRDHPAHRRAPAGPLPALGALFDRSRPLDDALVDRLAERLRALPAPRRVLVPLGIGGHLDHRTARAAAERAFTPQTLRYVEDFPYSRSFRARWRVLGLATLADSLDRSFGRWRFEPAPLAPDDLDAKISASAAYTSQIAPLFGDLHGLEEQMERASARAARGLLEAHAEPTWRKAGSMGSTS